MDNSELLQAIKSMIQEEIKPIKEEVSQINQRLGNIECQQTENSNYIQALLHRSEELDAKFDGLLHATASKEAFKSLDAKLDRVAADMTFLVRKAAEHEDDIRNLKLIK